RRYVKVRCENRQSGKNSKIEPVNTGWAVGATYACGIRALPLTNTRSMWPRHAYNWPIHAAPENSHDQHEPYRADRRGNFASPVAARVHRHLASIHHGFIVGAHHRIRHLADFFVAGG